MAVVLHVCREMAAHGVQACASMGKYLCSSGELGTALFIVGSGSLTMIVTDKSFAAKAY
jgi:hypothetical protein